MSFAPATHESDVRARLGREHRLDTQKTVLDARQRLTSTSGTKAAFDFELLDEYAQSRLGSALAVTALLVILAALLCVWVPPVAAAVWAGLVIAANLGVALLSRQFRIANHAKFNAGKWTARFVVAESVYGLAWSTLALMPFLAGGENLSVLLFAMVLVCVAANAVSTRTLPGATLVSTIPAAFAVCAHLVLSGGTLNYTLAVVVLGGEIFFVYLARQLHTSVLETVMHQAEKDALINELEEARNM